MGTNELTYPDPPSGFKQIGWVWRPVNRHGGMVLTTGSNRRNYPSDAVLVPVFVADDADVQGVEP